MSTTLTVGVGQQFQTIAAAIAAANTTAGAVVLQIVAGTYVYDSGTITDNNVTVEGIGGTPKLVGATLALAGNNIVVENLDVFGVASGAGILVESGEARIANVHVHDNQTGIASLNDPAGNVAIVASDIGNNATNIAIGAIAALSVNSSLVHDAQGGDEIKSLAQATTLSGVVVADNASASAYALDLPKGGVVQIIGAEIEKGPNSTTASMISDGSAGALYPNSTLDIGESYLINDVFPNTDTVFDRPIANLQVDGANLTWNLPHLGGGVTASSNTFEPLSARPAIQTYTQVAFPSYPTLTVITGNRDGGVTLAGSYQPGGVVTVADTAYGATTLLGSAVADSSGHFHLTSHARIDTATLNAFTASGIDSYARVTSMPGALLLTDTGADHLTSAAGVANVFAVMSFKGSDIIDGFKTTSAAGSVHDVLNFSGRGITNFDQVQAMLSGSTSSILTLSSGKTITLAGVNPTTLSATDFAYS